MLLRRILHIVGILLVIVFISSCAKDELEAPTDGSGEPKAITIDDIHVKKGDAIKKNNDLRDRSSGEFVEINDDDDEEDEDRNPSQ